MRPTQYLQDWSPRDRGLAEALILHEDDTHAHCGHRLSVATDPDMDGWYEVDDSTVCHACAALESWQEQTGSAGQRTPGVLPRVVDTRPPPAERTLTTADQD